MRIAFLYREGRLRRLRDIHAGKGATEFLYGALELQKMGHDVTMFDITGDDQSKIRRFVLNWMARHSLLPYRVYGNLLLHVRQLLPRLREFDLIVATTSGIAFSVTLWRILGRVSPPIVGIHVGLVDNPETELPLFQRTLNGYLLRRMWSQFYSEAELKVVQALYCLSPDRVSVNGFGVDTCFWTPGDGKESNYILSVGNDGRRDYELLVAVARKINHPFIVVTARSIRSELPTNLTVVPGNWHEENVSDEQLRELYRRALCVVIPLVETLQPSGQSVCLQAMACGKPVVLTRTRGLWSEQMMKDGVNVIFVPPKDGDVLADAIEDLLANSERRKRLGRSARETVCAEADIENFAQRLERLCALAVTQALRR